MRDILEVIEADDQMPLVPEGLEPALKFVKPDWTTYGGFKWPFPGQWTVDEGFNARTCVSGGVHVAFSVCGAQSGGARYHNALVVAFDPSDECSEWPADKTKVASAVTLAPIDLIGAIRRAGQGADLQGASLEGANLRRANLKGANLREAYLGGADFQGADLQGANLREASLRRANLQGANLQGANLRGANLWGADLQGADLQGANLKGALGA